MSRPRLLRGCVQTCKKSLCRSLFIACGAVDLAGEKQSAQASRFERRIQLARIDVVVFDRVAGTHDARFSNPGIVATSACCMSSGSDVEIPFG